MARKPEVSAFKALREEFKHTRAAPMTPEEIQWDRDALKAHKLFPPEHWAHQVALILINKLVRKP